MNALVGVRAIHPLGSSNIEAAKRAETASQTAASASLPTKAAVTTKAAATDTTSTGIRQLKQELDRDAFLQLLVLQMQSQDPLSPTDNTQMIAQLAQFTSLEQMNNLNTSFTSLATEVDRLNFISAGSLLGRSVSGADAQGVLRQGKVEQVYFDSADGGGVYLVVQGQPVPLANVQQIEAAAAESTAAAKK